MRRRDDSHHDLETVEALGFGSLDFGRKSLDQVLIDDTVRLRVRMLGRKGSTRHSQQQRKRGRAR